MSQHSAVVTKSQLKYWCSELERLEHYAGVHRRVSVEKRLSANEFVLYHERPENLDGDEQLPLMVGYRTSFGDRHHYEVKSSKRLKTAFKLPGPQPRRFFYVDTGSQRAPAMFASLTALCEYHEQYGHIRPTNMEHFGDK